MKPGSKYYPLFQYLQQCDREETTLLFAEIETLLGCSLPNSAFSKKNWWSNRDSAGALQAGAWISASYQIKSIDLVQQSVTFHKFRAQYNIQRKDGEMLWQQDAIKALRKHMGLTQSEFSQEIGVRRQTVSEWENGAYDPDRSTTKFLELIAKQSDFQAPVSEEL
jgi:DNA-binding transcriptional regulator YiaG